jgi:hypothetical protein
MNFVEENTRGSVHETQDDKKRDDMIGSMILDKQCFQI